MRVEISSGIIVFRNADGRREYLLLDRKEGFLDFPKGHIEEGEDEKQAAMRETEEETGLQIVPENQFRKEMEYWFRFKGDLIHKKVVMFTGENSSGKSPSVSFEHIGFKWLDYEMAMKRLKYQNQKEMLAEVESFLNTAQNKV